MSEGPVTYTITVPPATTAHQVTLATQRQIAGLVAERDALRQIALDMTATPADAWAARQAGAAAEPAEAALTDGVLLELLAIRAIAERAAQRPAGPPAAYQRALARIARLAGLAMDRLLVEAV